MHNYYFIPGDKSTNYCLSWYSEYWEIFYLTLSIGLVVGLVNILSEVFIDIGSELLTRPINYTWQVIDVMKGISWIQFINLGLVFMVISLNINFVEKSVEKSITGQFLF